jgi:acyl carrier protein/pimeloyl-ACP methyl ester carboxylesterase
MYELRRIDMPELGEFADAEDPRQAALARFWADATGFDRVGIDDDFFALGGTSIQAARLFDRIELEFGVVLPLATLYNAPTVRALEAEIARRARPGARPPVAAESGRLKRLVPIRADGGRPPLFVSAGIGGGVVGLAHFTRALDREQPVFGLESRGLDGAEKPLFDIDAIAAEYVDEIVAVQPDGPIRLFGVCWGALVVLELARRFRESGRTVDVLALLDPPPIRGRRMAGGGSALASALTLPRFIASRLGLYWKTLRSLPRDRRREYLRGRLGLLRRIVVERDLFRGDSSELWRRKVRQANLIAARRYVPADYSLPVRLLLTTDRPDGPSRASREYWIRHLHLDGAPVQVPGRDTSDAMSAALAHHVAAALAPRLAPAD